MIKITLYNQIESDYQIEVNFNLEGIKRKDLDKFFFIVCEDLNKKEKINKWMYNYEFCKKIPRCTLYYIGFMQSIEMRDSLEDYLNSMVTKLNLEKVIECK